MNELSNVDMMFLNSVLKKVPENCEHRFSLRYRLKKRKIIRFYENGVTTPKHKYQLKIKYAVIAIVLACVVVIAGFGIFKFFDGFRVTDYDVYSLLYVNSEANSAPQSIENKFYLDIDISDFDVQTVCDDDYQYWLEFSNGNYTFSVNQSTINSSNTIMINTENAKVMPNQISINNWKGIYFETYDGMSSYVFNTGEYVIMYCSNIDKNKLENIVKSTKFN